METMTGTVIRTCPWSSFLQPIVQRAMRALPYFESGQLAFVEPEPSHRLVEALTHYTGVDNRMHGKQLDMEREKRTRDMNAARSAAEGHRRG